MSSQNVGSARARILFVFAWLVVGGEETEVRLLARHIDRTRFKLDVVACFHQRGMPDQTQHQLADEGVDVDTTPYGLSFVETVQYLATKMHGYDLVVSCQAVRDLYPALAMMERRPALVEHGGLVSEALAGPKHWTSRYVGVCRSIRDAAATRMPGQEGRAIEIPSMVDLGEFDPALRQQARRELGVGADEPLIGWVGRLDRKKRVEDFITAASLVRQAHPHARFVVVGGPDSFMPDYARELCGLTAALGLDKSLAFLGDRVDVPRLLSAMDVFVWLSRDEGMPHVVAEAGAAGLPVVVTRDNGTEEQIQEGVSGLFVPHEDATTAASAILRLVSDPDLRRRLGASLHAKVEREYGASAVTRRWEALFDEVIEEHRKLVQTERLQRADG